MCLIIKYQNIIKKIANDGRRAYDKILYLDLIFQKKLKGLGVIGYIIIKKYITYASNIYWNFNWIIKLKKIIFFKNDKIQYKNKKFKGNNYKKLNMELKSFLEKYRLKFSDIHYLNY